MENERPEKIATGLPAPRTLEAPAKPSATHEAIDATGYGPAMKAALHLVLESTPYRD